MKHITNFYLNKYYDHHQLQKILGCFNVIMRNNKYLKAKSYVTFFKKNCLLLLHIVYISHPRLRYSSIPHRSSLVERWSKTAIPKGSTEDIGSSEGCSGRVVIPDYRSPTVELPKRGSGYQVLEDIP